VKSYKAFDKKIEVYFPIFNDVGPKERFCVTVPTIFFSLFACRFDPISSCDLSDANFALDNCQSWIVELAGAVPDEPGLLSLDPAVVISLAGGRWSSPRGKLRGGQANGALENHRLRRPGRRPKALRSLRGAT